MYKLKAPFTVRLLFVFTLLTFCACGGSEEGEVKPPPPPSTGNNVEEDKKIPGNYVVSLEAETQSLVRNPLMGWAIYADAYNPDFEFWNKFDNIKVGHTNYPLKATNYATHLYIRWPWSAFESREGVYAWNTDDFFRYLEDGAVQRGLKLAFRIYVDSRDYTTSSTPGYVRDAGAKGYMGNTNRWSPYPDDPVFQEKYAAFVRAFAARYDNPDKVDFIDGFGLGRWGEGHTILLSDDGNYAKTFRWITNLYLTNFKKIALAVNYHTEIGSVLLNEAYDNGYVLRHDAFGMSQFYGTFEKTIAKEQFPKNPIIAENGWWHNNNSLEWMKDPNGYLTWRDVWAQTLSEALEARANILDLRNISETTSWLDSSKDLVDQFIAKGGYRLYPDRISLPKKIRNGSTITIQHRWSNLGIGVCPNNIKQWNKKYKVAFALLDKQTNKAISLFIDDKANPHEWLLNNPVEYEFTPQVKDLAKGDYFWGVAIIDVTKNNVKGLNLSVKNIRSTTEWISLFEMTVE